jgi:Kef-type K+ transport system membrane component KefB
MYPRITAAEGICGMPSSETPVRLVVVVLALAAGLLVAAAGGRLARAARQPDVIGEIAGGLLAGPLLVALVGARRFHQLLPAEVLGQLKLVAEVGLVLFLVGLAHGLRRGDTRGLRRSMGWVALGSSVLPLLAGALLAGWVLLVDDPAVRGAAPVPALVLMLAVALTVTAVPVLARVLADRGKLDSAAGRLALSAAIATDAGCWLLLAVAISLRSGRPGGFLLSLAVLAGGGCVALLLRFLLRTKAVERLAMRTPRWTAVALGAVGLATALGIERLGMTAVFGAVLVGLAVPTHENESWAPVVASVGGLGRRLVPAFFVVTGITLFTGSFATSPWPLIVVTVVLGAAGKLGGGYLGARLGGQDTPVALRVGALMNTRGLTELIVLQAGYAAGILTGPLYLALVVMALVTTASTGPLLSLLDRHQTPAVAAGTGTGVR